MARDLFSRYVWIIDTLVNYGPISRKRINDLWLRASVSDGKPIPERTFFHYRRSIEENFNIDIECNAAGEYFIDKASLNRNHSLTNWMLDSYAVNGALSDAADAGNRIIVEDVPSARGFLPPVIDALKQSLKIIFTYAGFNRTRAERDITFSPWFLKRYKQRWYMLGVREKDNSIRTYALDRIKELRITESKFNLPDSISPDDHFGNIIGITSSKAPVREVRIKTDATRAKYLRALPLHPSQSEIVNDGYSIFTYQLKLNYELVHEIISFGNSAMVLDPPELRLMVTQTLRQALDQYS